MINPMRTIPTALMITFATQAGAECGNLCDSSWWGTATNADVQAELNAGADVMARDDGGDTPLHTMALLSTLGVKEIEALVAAGADIMALGNGGDTPLHNAAWGGKPETTKALIAAGADVMAQDSSGDTPLHAAAEVNGATDVKNNILALLAAGADVMVQNKDGKIPWDYAKNNDDIDETDE